MIEPSTGLQHPHPHYVRAKRSRRKRICEWSGRKQTFLARGFRIRLRNLRDQLAQDRLGELLIALRRDRKCARTADDVLTEILIEVGLDREDRQAIDPDAVAHGFVAGLLHRAAEIVRTVAGNVDDALGGAIGARSEYPNGIVDGAG